MLIASPYQSVCGEGVASVLSYDCAGVGTDVTKLLRSRRKGKSNNLHVYEERA
jgi:hypothetical protein